MRAAFFVDDRLLRTCSHDRCSHDVPRAGVRQTVALQVEFDCSHRLEDAGVDLLLLQFSPQAEEMERFAEQVINRKEALAAAG